MSNKIAKDDSLQSILVANQGIKTGLENLLTQLITRDGRLADLTTPVKTSLVSAINAVYAETQTNKTNINALHDIYAILDEASTSENGAGIHNSLYRGKNLGSALTADQIARINDGTFKGLWLGDYFTKSVTTNYYEPPKDSSGYAIQGDDTVTSLTVTPQMAILDHNYYLKSGDTRLTQPHLNMGPLANLYAAPMNKKDSSGANFTTGAYALSEMRTKYLEAAVNIFAAIFGAAHLLSYRGYLQNAVTNGRPTGGAWYTSLRRTGI